MTKKLQEDIIRVYGEIVADTEHPHTPEEIDCIIAASCDCDISDVREVLRGHCCLGENDDEPILKMHKMEHAIGLEMSTAMLDVVPLDEAYEVLNEKDRMAICGISILTSGIGGLSSGLLKAGFSKEELCMIIRSELANHLAVSGLDVTVSIVPAKPRTSNNGNLPHFPS